MPKLFLNDNEVSFQMGQTILDVAKENGVDIPTLCHIPSLDAAGLCRICVVEADGNDDLLPACATPAGEDMRIQTDSPQVRATRKSILEMIVESGLHNCFAMDLPKERWSEDQIKATKQPWHDKNCPAHGDCRLQSLAVEYSVSMKNVGSLGEDRPLDDEHPMIVRDFSRCIGCGRCVQVCNEIQVNGAIPPPYGRREDYSGSRGWLPEADYLNCTHCGECVQACPVGALFEKKSYGLFNKREDAKKVRSTCTYCGVGCQLELNVIDGKIVRVTSDPEAPGPNRGSLCVKGRFGYDFINHPDRLKTPLIKENGEFKEASWDEALDLVARRFSEIKENQGPDALAFFTSARCSNEENYLMNKFARAVVGTNNIDHCARL